MSQENEINVSIKATDEGLGASTKKAAEDVKQFANDANASANKAQSAWANIGPIFGGVADAINDELFERGGNYMGGFGKKCAEVAEAVRENFEKMPVAVQNAAVAIGAFLAVVGTVALTKKAVEQTADYTEASLKLARAMGESATTASVWIEVAKDVNSSTEEVQAAVGGLSRKLRENEESLNKMGVVTRDANGDLLGMDKMLRGAIEAVNGHKAGTDRNLASQEIFGRAVAGNSNLLLANAEAFAETEAYVRSLGGYVSEEAVAAYREYDQATDNIGHGMTAMRNIIGNALMPAFADMAGMLADALPAAATVLRGALGGVMTAFYALENGVIIVWETIKAFIYSIAEPLRALSAAIAKSIVGDFTGAKNELTGIGDNIKARWSMAMDEMAKSSERTAQRIKGMFDPSDAAKPDGSGKGYVSPKEKKEKTEKDASRMGEYELELERQQIAFQKENDLREMSKQQIIDYWQKVHDAASTSAKDRESIERKISKTELDILKDAAKQREGLANVSAEAVKLAEMSRIDEVEAAAKMAVQSNEMTQAEYLQQEKLFISQRLAAEIQFINQKEELARRDPEKNTVLLEQLEQKKAEIRQRYRKADLQNEMQIAKEQQKWQDSFGKSLQSNLASVFSKIGTQIKTLNGLIRNVFAATSQAVIGMLANMAAEWLAKQMMMLVFGKTKAVSEITTEAAKAGAGGTASMAAAPFPLNMTAPAFGAAMSAAAMAFAPMASASGGFDIPGGVNPITQLHQREMVLPAQYADMIREMTGNGGASNAGNITVHITAADAHDVKRLLLNNRSAVADALRGAARDFKK